MKDRDRPTLVKIPKNYVPIGSNWVIREAGVLSDFAPIVILKDDVILFEDGKIKSIKRDGEIIWELNVSSAQ